MIEFEEYSNLNGISSEKTLFFLKNQSFISRITEHPIYIYKQIVEQNKKRETIEIRNSLWRKPLGKLLSISEGKGIILSGLFGDLLGYLEATWREKLD